MMMMMMMLMMMMATATTTMMMITATRLREDEPLGAAHRSTCIAAKPGRHVVPGLTRAASQTQLQGPRDRRVPKIAHHVHRTFARASVDGL